MTRFRYSGLISLLFLAGSFRAGAQMKEADLIDRSLHALSEVLINDITSPPVASRDYAYPLIAFYEVARNADTSYRSYAGQLNELGAVPTPLKDQPYDWLVAGATAFYKTAYAFVFSKEMFKVMWAGIDADLKARKVTPAIFERSVQYGQQVADHILLWAKGDNYGHTRTLPRFTPDTQPGTWKQTGPDYMEAVEPNWKRIRPMTLSKPDLFTIPGPAAFTSEEFKKEVQDVYDAGNKLTTKQKAIANFWDCNPFATQTVGHMMYSVKKISPAGHWMGITGVAVRQKRMNLVQALQAYSLVSVAIFDVIISAWDEKYRSNYIRPVTAIQQSISPTWQPLLQTPPFPEYPSGHSVISNASATILTGIFGSNFHYTDDVEKPFGLAARSFTSFFAAADEAAISRFYGGIHFREAIENGKLMGRMVGEYVLKTVHLKVIR
jgi:PAP2 superfamily